MAIVAGVDFGTLSVRVSIVDSERGLLASAIAEYPLHRKRDDPDYATQSHEDHMRALADGHATGGAGGWNRWRSGPGHRARHHGSSVIPVGDGLVPLDDYYLWCDHRAKNEAAEITELRASRRLEAIQWCGGVYSSEWGFAKLLHWLRHNPGKARQTRHRLRTLRHGGGDALRDHRSAPASSAASAPWATNGCGMPLWAAFLPKSFWPRSIRCSPACAKSWTANMRPPTRSPERSLQQWAEKLGLRAGIPIPVGAFDAHWDAIGAGAHEGDVVNVVGTSTCIMAYAAKAQLIPGVCGVVPGSVHPQYTGIEAGLSAPEISSAPSRGAPDTTVAELSKGLENYRAGQTGLLRMTWDNGDRTVLVNPNLGGMTLGWNLLHTAQDELFAAIEGTAFHTRVILDRMSEYGAPTQRVINGGGIPQNNPVLNQVYANVLGRPVLVPSGKVTGLGSAIFAFMAAGAFKTIGEAQSGSAQHTRSINRNRRRGDLCGTLRTLSENLFRFRQPG